MKQIKSISDIFAVIPDSHIKPSGEYHSPCPFCAGDGTSFEGEDRFFWLDQANLFHCRHCGNHSLDETCERLFGYAYRIADGFVETSDQRSKPVKNALFLHDQSFVDELHHNVQRDYWYNFGWNDATIDTFQLGYGHLYYGSIKVERHIIPFIPQTLKGAVDGFALEGRLSHNVKGEERNIKTAGLGSDYFACFIDADAVKNSEVSTAVICEGIKDGITAWQLGYRAVYCLLGKATDMNVVCAAINDCKYERVIAFMDKDQAGAKYFKQIEKRILHGLYTIYWPPNVKAAYDLTNLLEDYATDTELYIEQNLYSVQGEVRGFITDVRVYQPDYKPPTPDDATPLEQIYKELPLVLDDFFDNYQVKRRNAGKGVIKVLAGDTGIGKSRAMVAMAEKLAKRVLEAFNIEYQALSNQIAEYEAQIAQNKNLGMDEILDFQQRIEHFTTRRDNLSCAKILYAGPFINGWDDIIEQNANMALWFNYEARNTRNCDNLSAVTQLANKGYSPASFCHQSCRFKELCEQRGYLAQDRERRSKPITYVRHQQLKTSMIDEYKYIFIDENCLSVFDDPLIVGADELAPTYDFWNGDIDQNQTVFITELVDAIRTVLRSADPDYVYSGRQVMMRLDQAMLGSLQATLESIDPDAIAAYHPSTVMGNNIDYSAVPMRCLPAIYNVLLDELNLYLGEVQNYNSGLHINQNRLEMYSLTKNYIPQNHPIVISDGTSFPELYGYLFDREIETYAPIVYNEQAKTVQLHGSDFTRTSINSQVGFGMRDFNRWLEDNHMVIDDVFGQKFDLTKLPVDDNIYDSSIFKRIISLLKSYAEKHESLLFVTYKNVRALIEHRMSQLYPDLHAKIHYSHYWSLRGTNRYKDVEAVLLIGCPRVPYEVLYRKIQAWAKLAGLPWISPVIQHRITPYHGVFRFEGNTYPTFDDEFADRFVDMVESGEIRQCAARIRPYSSRNPKYTYAALSRPSLRWVTALDRVGRFANSLDSQRYRNAYNTLYESYVQNKTFPTYDSIAKAYHLSYSKIREMRSKIQSDYVQ